MKQIFIILTITFGLVECSDSSTLQIEDGIYLMTNDRSGYKVDFMNCLEPDCYTFVDSIPYLTLSELTFEIDKEHEFMDMLWCSMETTFPPVNSKEFKARHDFDGISHFTLVLDGQVINYEPVFDSMVSVQFSVSLEDWKPENLKYLEGKLKK